MTVVVNPFAGDGFSLAEMTESINLLPDIYTRLGQLGLFREEPISQRVALVEMANGVLSLLPSVRYGGPATVAAPESSSVRPFNVPWIPHDDVLTPEDIQGIRAFGTANSVSPAARIMLRKLTRIRQKHAQTLEYMRVNSMRGILKDGAGTTLNNFFTEWGVSQQTVDFVFGTATTDILGKIRSALRMVEDELKGESMSGALVLASSTWFDKFIGHAKVVDAYKYFSSGGANPLRDDVRRRFPFGGVMIEEYNATVTLSTGSTEKLIPDGDAYMIPMGTTDTFVTYFAPARHMDAVGTLGEPMYAWQLPRPDGTGIDIKSQSSPLPLNKRPRLVVRLYSST